MPKIIDSDSFYGSQHPDVANPKHFTPNAWSGLSEKQRERNATGAQLIREALAAGDKIAEVVDPQPLAQSEVPAPSAGYLEATAILQEHLAKKHPR